MMHFITKLRRVLADCRAASSTEYALMGGILAVGLVSAFSALVSKLSNTFSALSF